MSANANANEWPSPIRVAIVGATGNLGTAITNALLSHGDKVQVTLLLRALPADAPAAKQAGRTALLDQGARAIDIDVQSASIEELATALRDTDVVLSTVGIELLKEGQLKLVEAAKIAGVKRFIPSEFGIDMDKVGRGGPVSVWDFKLDVQDAIKKAGLDYTFIEVGIFAEYIAPFAGVDPATKTLTAPGSFDARISLSPLGDVGRQTADLVVSGRGRNETVFFGTVNYSWSEFHAALERSTGEKWTKAVKDKAEFETAAKADENDWVARVGLIYLAGKGTHFPHHDTYAHKHKIALGDFEEVLRTVLAPAPK
ncbi:hypothetical protein HKX48_001225 [Thoreauomyces humboldtii]|nr:hypothetical protein HKX48_001225 [Thoreauomyces humboldtii]